MAISPSASRTIMVPVTRGCCPRSFTWPTKPASNVGWDCYLNIAADLKDSNAVVSAIAVSAVYTDGDLALSEPITTATAGLIGVSFSAGTGGYVYAIEFLVTFQDSRVFAYYASLPVLATPSNLEE